MSKIIYQEESYKLVGILFEVYNQLGDGFAEIVYKDALEYEFKTNEIDFEREKEFLVNYKEIVLKHKFYADFVVLDKIILEIKACPSITDIHIAQTINYLKISGFKLGIIANFGNQGLEYKRLVL